MQMQQKQLLEYQGSLYVEKVEKEIKLLFAVYLQNIIISLCPTPNRQVDLLLRGVEIQLGVLTTGELNGSSQKIAHRITAVVGFWTLRASMQP